MPSLKDIKASLKELSPDQGHELTLRLASKLKEIAASPDVVDQVEIKDISTRLVLQQLSAFNGSNRDLLNLVDLLARLGGWFVERREVQVNSHGMDRLEEKAWEEEVSGIRALRTG